MKCSPDCRRASTGSWWSEDKEIKGNGKGAKVVLMHKILRVVYGMLKSGKPDIAIDQKDIEKEAEKQGDIAQQKLQQVGGDLKKSRRYLPENIEDSTPI